MNQNHSEELVFLIITETIRLFDLPYILAQSFGKEYFEIFELDFISLDHKIGFCIQIASKLPDDYKSVYQKKRKKMKEKYDLLYFEIFDSEIAGCKILHDVALRIRYKE